MADGATAATGASWDSLAEAAEKLAAAGPIGLVIFLILVVGVVLIARNLDENRAGILRLVIYCGTFCFVVLCVVTVIPLLLAKPAAASTDLTAQLQQCQATASHPLSLLNALSLDADRDLAELKAAVDITNNPTVCPGGSNGVALPHSGEIAGHIGAVVADLRGWKERADRMLPGD